MSRELDIQSTVIRQRKRRVETGAATAVVADEDVVPASLLRAAQGRIKEIERSLGRKQHPVAAICRAHELGLEPLTTPAYSPQSNGLAEAFVHTFKRD